MKNKFEIILSQMLAWMAFILCIQCVLATEKPEILVKGYTKSNFTTGAVPKILKLTENGVEEVAQVREIIGKPLFTLKSDPVRVQSDFKTVDISVINKEREKERAKKVAIVQEDLQSRIKINNAEGKTEQPEPELDIQPSPEEVIKKQARVKEDIESRVFGDGFLRIREDTERQLHYPMKRSDEGYYSDEPEPIKQRTTEPPKEEDSFFSIFESLFGSSDDDSQSKKKSKPEEEPLFREADDDNMKENIKTVGDILKPLRPIDEPESKTQNAYSEYQSDAPEYRIVNNFHPSQQHKHSYKPLEPKPNYQSFYRPTEKPLRPPFKPHTNGYEDYDLEEFLDKKETTTRVKYVSPIVTTIPTRSYPTTTTTTATTTTVRTTPKNTFDNKLKFPSVQKKNDYINRNRLPEKNEVTEKPPERTTFLKPEIKSTTEFHHYSRPNHENKDNEIKTQKIQESPNFYNLINLPVRYSTKDTAIPLISTSYANTKIQGMGAHKYEKGANGKYPNHKYDQISTSTTQKPSYWATKRTSTERTFTSFRPSLMITKTTSKYPPENFDKVDYDDTMMGMGPAYGGYGSKTGVEIRTQAPVGQTSTTKKTTTMRDEVTQKTLSQPSVFKPKEDKETEKESSRPVKEVYEDYEYYNFQETENYPPNFIKEHRNELQYNSQYQTNQKTTPTSTVTPVTVMNKPQESMEYEYYDYDVDPSTTTTTSTTTTKATTVKTTASITSTTPNYKIKYPNLPKEKIKTSSSEKVAVVVPLKNHEFFNENQSVDNIKTLTRVVLPSTTTVSTTPPISIQTTTTTTKTTEPEIQKTSQFHKPEYKEPAPVFEDIKDDTTTNRVTASTTKKVVFEKPSTTTVEPVIVTSVNEQGDANIVLVPAKDTVKKGESEYGYAQPEVSIQKIQQKPNSIGSSHDYTTEFTVGVVHAGNGAQTPKIATAQGHYVASSISTNPYGDDEPFRPIPKPPGMSSSFQVREEIGQPPKSSQTFHKRPFPTPPVLEETEPIHEPHEFIPSPQFHRPGETKPSGLVRPGSDVDYDFEGIQTEPKPGQYVIFSKPQLNPEMNENQLKKKPEISAPTKVSSVPHYHEKVNQFGQEAQKHVVFNPGEGQIYTSSGKPKPSDKEQRPVYGTKPETDDHLSLQLVPPRGNQHEKPYEGNFVVPEGETKESTVSYPRPHWEKNGKPSFLLNTLSNKNDMIGNRHVPVPPQMAATLIPPSNIPPQRFRRPIQNHMSPVRKNFNEAGTNVKPKPNLPNILPQFRPNAKVGSGPYHRPPGYVSNRRTGMNRYHEKEHGNFPYHILHPDKEAMMHREYEMGPEIIPKFITNRGKLPSEIWNSQGMQKRFGQGPLNMLSVPQYERVLRRHQRTPVTTLQMLKQRPGLKAQKTQLSTEGRVDPSAPLVPPFYKTYKDEPKTEENVYIVYPAKAPQKLHPDNTKVFIVSDTKSQKKFYNFTKPEEQHLLLNSNKRVQEKPKFPYGFVKPTERVKINRKQTEERDESNIKEDVKIIPEEKDEKIDMVLHMQSNNQWNEVKSLPDSMASVRNPPNSFRNDHYRFSDHSGAENSELQVDPPSEYHTSIKDDGDSAFTLGAVMHTMSDGSRKGQVTSVSLHNDKEVNVPKLNVNERISNGKIVAVSMPLDVKQDPNEKESQDKYQFQAPFQASSSLTSNESHPISQGWSIVKNPDDKSDGEDGKETETSTNPHFNFENFKPELIGGFKPIYELPDEIGESKEQEKVKEREE